MNIHEHQAKEILRGYGIPVPQGQVVFTPEEAARAAWKIETDKAVVKAQIHAGGRGKAGGVKIASSVEEVEAFSQELLGKVLVTHQTGPQGKEVRRLWIEESCQIQQEIYLAFAIDPDKGQVVMIASAEGGMEIEVVAQTAPDKIFKEAIDPLLGVRPFQVRRVAYGLGLAPELVPAYQELVQNLYRCFVERDCSLAEINPLVITQDQKLMALDAKLSFDDNSLYRQEAVKAYRDLTEEDEREIQAAQHGLAYIALDGNIGCMVNGAGLAMATMDMIQFYGGTPANFLDVGGGASVEKVKAAFQIILADPRVSGIFVNIFGGIMKCDVIAEGIVAAAREIQLQVPLVVRLEGTRVTEGKGLLQASGLPIHSADSMAEGAKQIVLLAQQKGGADHEHLD